MKGDADFHVKVGEIILDPFKEKEMTLRDENAALFTTLVRCWEYMEGKKNVTEEEVRSRLSSALNYYGRSINRSESPVSSNGKAKADKPKRPVRMDTGEIEDVSAELFKEVLRLFRRRKWRKWIHSRQIAKALEADGVRFHRPGSSLVTVAMMKHCDDWFEIGKMQDGPIRCNTYRYIPGGRVR